MGAKLRVEAQRLDSGSGLLLSTDFQLTSIVTFIDVSESPTISSQVTSSNDSRYSLSSPVDFFYPFIWATSSANTVTLHDTSLLSVVSVSLLVCSICRQLHFSV